MTKLYAREGTGLSPGVSSLETEHPLVTRWKSSLKDNSLGGTSSQGPGQAAAKEDSHTAVSPSAQPQAQGAPASPFTSPAPGEAAWLSFPLGFTSLGKSNATLLHCAVGQRPCSQFYIEFFEPIRCANFIL